MHDLSYEQEEVNVNGQPPHDSDAEEQPRRDATQPSEEEELTEDAWEIRVPTEMKRKLAGPWKTSIILKLMGRQLGYRALQTRLAGIWRPTGLPTCSHGWTMVCGRPILTRGGMGGDLDSLRTITYRILSPDFLKHVRNKLGKLFKVDAVTSAAIRGRYARLCVQFNMAYPLPKRVKIGVFWLDIVYENLSMLCYRCERLGHRKVHCTESSKELKATFSLRPEPVESKGRRSWSSKTHHGKLSKLGTPDHVDPTPRITHEVSLSNVTPIHRLPNVDLPLRPNHMQ
ncbi:hypothetical protein CFP56_044033 [Quercus suber]|uniref:CCHC-type domain-containing protein n=1 Tax=Quercus suber TaxID=58331 RepID=A0AAW0LGF9_QUESU